MTCTKTVKIINIKKETDNVKTIRFKYDADTKPGRFFMVWVPGIDEIPMSASYTKEVKGITVEKIGEATSSLHKMKIGDKIGIRGPYGNGFKLAGKRLLFVAGGTGIISLAPAIENASENKKDISVVIGAKTRGELIFVQRIKKTTLYSCAKRMSIRGIFVNEENEYTRSRRRRFRSIAEGNSEVDFHISTDDGSIGYHGFASDLAKELLEKEKFNSIIACGPEIMMKKILELGLKNKIPVQASLERFMKCGIGICDSCAIDGLHICKDGPVFDDKKLKKIPDFGRFKRDSCGRRIKI